MVEGQHHEGPPAGALGDDGEEAGVDGAEVVVMDAAGDGHAIVAGFLGGRLAEHVAELGAAVLRSPCHLGGEEDTLPNEAKQLMLSPADFLAFKFTRKLTPNLGMIHSF